MVIYRRVGKEAVYDTLSCMGRFAMTYDMYYITNEVGFSTIHASLFLSRQAAGTSFTVLDKKSL